MRYLALFSLALALTGCAQTKGNRLVLADNMAYLCKHCNCYMAADTKMDAECSVCKCGYLAHHCIRGKSEE